MEIQYYSLFSLLIVTVVTTVRVSIRYEEAKLEVHLYSPASPRLNELNVRVDSRDMPMLPPTLSHRNLLLNPFSRSSPLTSHVREYLCPTPSLPLNVMRADNAGAV